MKLSVIKKLTVSLLVLATLPAMADSPARFEKGHGAHVRLFEKDHDSTFVRSNHLHRLLFITTK